MKILSKVITICAFLLIYSNAILAQPEDKKLNQIELMKKMSGSWKSKITRDTTAFWDARLNGTRLEVYDKYLTKGKLLIAGKELYGYDKSIDKYINAGMFKGKGIGVYVFWFLTNSTYVVIPYSDISSPEQASFRVEGEFKSHDVIVETEIVNNKQVKSATWIRVK